MLGFAENRQLGGVKAHGAHARKLLEPSKSA